MCKKKAGQAGGIMSSNTLLTYHPHLPHFVATPLLPPHPTFVFLFEKEKEKKGMGIEVRHGDRDWWLWMGLDRICLLIALWINLPF